LSGPGEFPHRGAIADISLRHLRSPHAVLIAALDPGGSEPGWTQGPPHSPEVRPVKGPFGQRAIDSEALGQGPHVRLLVPERDPSQGLDSIRGQGVSKGVWRLKMVPTDDPQRSGIERVIAPMEAIIEPIVEDQARSVVVAERRPADVVISPAPVDPTRAPNGRGDPVPAQSEPPMPAAVMISAPSPWLA
jgi:hypothetical protein